MNPFELQLIESVEVADPEKNIDPDPEKFPEKKHVYIDPGKMSLSHRGKVFFFSILAIFYHFSS